MRALELCEQLENELSGRRGFVNVKIDIAECRRIVSSLKEELYVSGQCDDNVAGNRNAILTNADNVAKNVLKAAEERAAIMVSQSEIMSRAQADSRVLLENAYNSCDALILKTKENLDLMLKDVEVYLRETIDAISLQRFKLKNMIIDSAGKSD